MTSELTQSLKLQTAIFLDYLRFGFTIILFMLNVQVHLNKLECRGKVHLFQ